MKKGLTLSACVVLTIFGISAARAFYGHDLCSYPQFSCPKVKRGDTWEKLWPDPRERDIVMRLNRTNLPLSTRSWVLVPKNLSSLNILDLSPFAAQIMPTGKTLVLVNLSKLAFGAYDAQGQLVHWGPISAGKSFCPDIQESCTTPTGVYSIFRKKSEDCISTIFPVEKEGGAPMPYCMFFNGGYALHGSPSVPGYNASHGCIRMYTEDARWLNEEFTRIGTSVVVTADDSQGNS